MLGIIIFHVNIGYFNKLNQLDNNNSNIFSEKVFLQFTNILGSFGDFIFFMIAGYFALNMSSKIKVRDFRIMIICLQYTVLITIIGIIMNFFGFDFYQNAFIQYSQGSSIFIYTFQLIQYFLTAGGLWFIYGYLILTLSVKPFLNKLKRISSKSLFVIVVVMFVVGGVCKFYIILKFFQCHFQFSPQ